MERHFLDLAGESPESFSRLLDRAAFWKRAVKKKDVAPILEKKVLAMIFQKPSNRTRVSFEMAMHHFGGKALYLSPQEIGLGKREATKDVARVLGRYVDAIMARVFAHRDVVELAEHAGVPVINGLSDFEHPCQALGDLQTVLEQGGNVVTYVGDGNNVSRSLARACELAGKEFRWIGPAEYGAPHQDLAKIAGSDFIYTDVWISMGDEAEADARLKAFKPYQLNADAVARAPHAKILHCLPAHRGEEITDEVIDSPNSVVLDQAENRLYAQMAVLERALNFFGDGVLES